MPPCHLDARSQLLLALYEKRDRKGIPETTTTEFANKLTPDDLYHAAQVLSKKGLAKCLPMLGKSVFAKITDEGIAVVEGACLT